MKHEGDVIPLQLVRLEMGLEELEIGRRIDTIQTIALLRSKYSIVKNGITLTWINKRK